MVTICGKRYMNTREKLLLGDIQKRKETKEQEEFFQKLKEGRDGRRSSVLLGTTVPNSTFKSIHSVGSENNGKCRSSITKIEITECEQLQTLKPVSENLCKEKDESMLNLVPPDKSSPRRSSILSGTGTIEELKELRDLLRKSSYVPKQTRTRRATKEKIISAIKKEKQASLEMASDVSDSYTETLEESSDKFLDASTETDKKKKKKKIKSSSNSMTSGGEQLKKREVKGKKTKKVEKVDIEIQCSIYKLGKTTRQKSKSN